VTSKMTGVTAGWSPFSRTLRPRVEPIPVVLIRTVPPFAFTFFHHRRELRKIVRPALSVAFCDLLRDVTVT